MRPFLCDPEMLRPARREAFAALNGLLEAGPAAPAPPDAVKATRLEEEARAQLAIARKLVADCGYHKRDDEVAELGAVLKGERRLADPPVHVVTVTASAAKRSSGPCRSHASHACVALRISRRPLRSASALDRFASLAMTGLGRGPPAAPMAILTTAFRSCHTRGMKVAVSIPDPASAEAEAFGEAVRTREASSTGGALGEFVSRHAADPVTRAMNE